MKITVLGVGKIRDAYLSEGIREYEKRLGRYCRLAVCEVADEKTPDGASAAQERQIRELEGSRLLHRIRDTDYVIALDLRGQTPDSLEFSGKLGRLALDGKSSVVFVIGGSLGLSDQVLARADESVSFSRLTFPHPLMRLILLEQIYRGFRILNHEPYHK